MIFKAYFITPPKIKAEPKIPKIIHYVWLGPNKMGPLEEKCINSWKKYLPDYKIMEWNENQLPLIDMPYVRKAYKEKKYAFVSDVFRFYALSKYGGIYFDTDTEVLKNMDEFLALDFFCGREKYDGELNLAMTPIGSIPNHPIINSLYNNYKNKAFDYSAAIEKPVTVTTTNQIINNEYLKKEFAKNKIMEIEKNAKIFPSWYFVNPKKFYKPYAIHHYRASWREDLQPVLKELISLNKISLNLYKNNNKMSDEFIWNFGEKVIFKIRISKLKYIVVTKKQNQ